MPMLLQIEACPALTTYPRAAATDAVVNERAQRFPECEPTVSARDATRKLILELQPGLRG